jgi:hypothetical protein
MESFFAHLGIFLKQLVSDLDTKLIGGKAHKHLNSLDIHVNAAPTNHQDKMVWQKQWQTLWPWLKIG